MKHCCFSFKLRIVIIIIIIISNLYFIISWIAEQMMLAMHLGIEIKLFSS